MPESTQAPHRSSGPFCGVSGGAGLKPLIWGAPNGRFNRGDLTYRVHLTGSHPELLAGIAGAFRTWANALKPFFSFRLAAVDAPADFDIDFALPFDPALPARQGTGSLDPARQHAIISLRSNLNGTAWTQGTLYPLMLHEIGHALGLAHSSEDTSVMYPFYGQNWPPYAIDDETRELLHDLYGWQSAQFSDSRSSAAAPALTVTNSPSDAQTVHMAWLSLAVVPTLWYSFSQDEATSWSTPTALSVPPEAAPAFGVAMCGSPEDPSAVSLAWTGLDGRLWVARRFRDSIPLTAEPVDRNTSDRCPAITIWRDRLCLVWKSRGDRRVWWSSHVNGSWTPAEVIQGTATDDAPAVDASNEQLTLGVGDNGIVKARVLRRDLGDLWADVPLTTYDFEASPITTDAHGNPRTVHTVENPQPIHTDGGVCITALDSHEFLLGCVQDGKVHIVRFSRGTNGAVPVQGAASNARPSTAATRATLICSWVQADGRLTYATSRMYVPRPPRDELQVPGAHPSEGKDPGGSHTLPEIVPGVIDREFDRDHALDLPDTFADNPYAAATESLRPPSAVSEGIKKAQKYRPNG